MKLRRIVVACAILLAVVVLGYASNVVGRDQVEAFMMARNLDDLAEIRKNWKLPQRDLRAVPRSAIAMRTARSAEGKLVRFPLPPRTEIPFAFAHAKSFAPFVLRVRYGFADGGTRVRFGEGGEAWVLSAFGYGAKIIKKRPAWYF